MRKPFFARFLVVPLILVLCCTLAVPAFAAEDLDHQYSFAHEFDFSKFGRIPDTPWYSVKFGDSLQLSTSTGDYVTFSIDGFKFNSSFKVFSSFHYIGNPSACLSGAEDNNEAYCMLISPDNPSNNMLLLRSDLFDALYQGNKTKIHVAISAAHFDFKQESFLDKLFSIFSNIGQWLRGQIDLIIGLFWNAKAVQLTFFGVLSLISLGISVVLLLIKLILNFLHFRS